MLCGRLARESGRTIEVSKDLAGLPVFVGQRSLTVPAVLRGVAFGLHASVLPIKAGWRIERTESDRKQMLKDAQAHWRGVLTEWFSDHERHIKEASVFGDAAAQVAHYQALVDAHLKKGQAEGADNAVRDIAIDPNELRPIGALHLMIANRIGIESLCSIGPSERRVWSNHPSGSQRSCPDGDRLLKKYCDQQQAFLSHTPSTEPYREPVHFTFKQVGGTSFDLKLYDRDGALVDRFAGPVLSWRMAGPILLSPASLARLRNHASSRFLDGPSAAVAGPRQTACEHQNVW